jgi:Uma2 family endonuclease
MVTQIMQPQSHTQTSEDIDALRSLPENSEKSFELINGVIYEVIMASSLHAFISLYIGARLLDFVMLHEFGYVYGDNCVYKLPNGDEVIPDVSFVSKGRGVPSFAAKLELAPDLAVEVASPSNTGRQMLNKVNSYLAAGTRMVWVVYPGEQVVDVFVFTPNADGSIMLRTLDINGTLDGGEVLPGFTLPVRSIFPAMPA